jgi:hypothetical protein
MSCLSFRRKKVEIAGLSADQPTRDLEMSESYRSLRCCGSAESGLSLGAAARVIPGARYDETLPSSSFVFVPRFRLDVVAFHDQFVFRERLSQSLNLGTG